MYFLFFGCLGFPFFLVRLLNGRKDEKLIRYGYVFCENRATWKKKWNGGTLRRISVTFFSFVPLCSCGKHAYRIGYSFFRSNKRQTREEEILGTLKNKKVSNLRSLYFSRLCKWRSREFGMIRSLLYSRRNRVLLFVPRYEQSQEPILSLCVG